MRSIAVLNQKGGVGKTTTAVNLSAALAEKGHRVLLVDLDPQAHASLHLGVCCERGDDSTYAVLTQDRAIESVRMEARDNLWIVGSHIDLSAAEVELASYQGREKILRRHAEAVAQDYDFFVIDCPPSLGLLTINALAAVEEVFLPLQPHFLALHGLSKLLRSIELVQKHYNDRLRLAGVLLCMFETGTRLATEVASDVEEFFEAARETEGPWSCTQVFKTRIRRNVRLAEAPSHGQSIFEYARSASGAEDYGKLAEEVLASAGHSSTVSMPQNQLRDAA